MEPEQRPSDFFPCAFSLRITHPTLEGLMSVWELLWRQKESSAHFPMESLHGQACESALGRWAWGRQRQAKGYEFQSRIRNHELEQGGGVDGRV